MKQKLESIRKLDKEINNYKKIINTLLVLFFGILLGIFAKWLDNLAINDEIFWQHIIGILDLRNVFSEFAVWIFLGVLISVCSNTSLRASLNVFIFFLGMTVSYHIYTVLFSGFNPVRYMQVWYTITAITPVLAYVCWYSKGIGKWSFFISTGIILVMMMASFSIGLWYFDLKSIIDTLLFMGTVSILYVKPKNTLFSVLLALVLVYILRFLSN